MAEAKPPPICRKPPAKVSPRNIKHYKREAPPAIVGGAILEESPARVGGAFVRGSKPRRAPKPESFCSWKPRREARRNEAESRPASK